MPSSRQSRRARIEPAELVDRQPESRRSTSAARRNCTSCARHRQCYIALLLGSVLANVVQLVAFYLSRPVERQASTRHSVRSSYYHALVGAVSTFHSDGENLSHGAALEWQAQQPLLPPEQQFQELHRQEQQLQEQQPQQKPQQPQQPQQPLQPLQPLQPQLLTPPPLTPPPPPPPPLQPLQPLQPLLPLLPQSQLQPPPQPQLELGEHAQRGVDMPGVGRSTAPTDAAVGVALPSWLPEVGSPAAPSDSTSELWSAGPSLPLSVSARQPAKEETLARHPQFRLAFTVPWIGKTFPSWFPYFLSSCRRSAFVADWLIFHEGAEMPGKDEVPPNVIFFDLGRDGLGLLFGTKLALALGMRDSTPRLVQLFQLAFREFAYIVTEYKPTHGTVFEDYLTAYTHWSYTDIDMLIGDLPMHIELEVRRRCVKLADW